MLSEALRCFNSSRQGGYKPTINSRQCVIPRSNAVLFRVEMMDINQPFIPDNALSEALRCFIRAERFVKLIIENGKMKMKVEQIS